LEKIQEVGEARFHIEAKLGNLKKDLRKPVTWMWCTKRS